MFFMRLRDAKTRLETSSLALLASGVTQNATKNGGICDACPGAHDRVSDNEQSAQYQSISLHLCGAWSVGE
jgi:hypothetical protein